MMKVIGYIRGSTEEQQNTLAAQESQIRSYGEFLQKMRETGATHIIVTKLDREFRGAVDLLLTMDILKEQGIGLHLLDIGLDPTTPVGEMVATIMASVAV